MSLRGHGNMTALVERGTDHLVTVSPVVRCSIFIEKVLHLSSVIKKLSHNGEQDSEA